MPDALDRYERPIPLDSDDYPSLRDMAVFCARNKQSSELEQILRRLSTIPRIYDPGFTHHLTREMAYTYVAAAYNKEDNGVDLMDVVHDIVCGGHQASCTSYSCALTTRKFEEAFACHGELIHKFYSEDEKTQYAQTSTTVLLAALKHNQMDVVTWFLDHGMRIAAIDPVDIHIYLLLSDLKSWKPRMRATHPIDVPLDWRIEAHISGKSEFNTKLFFEIYEGAYSAKSAYRAAILSGSVDMVDLAFKRFPPIENVYHLERAVRDCFEFVEWGSASWYYLRSQRAEFCNILSQLPQLSGLKDIRIEFGCNSHKCSMPINSMYFDVFDAMKCMQMHFECDFRDIIAGRWSELQMRDFDDYLKSS
jgi:hypothetical protein